MRCHHHHPESQPERRQQGWSNERPGCCLVACWRHCVYLDDDQQPQVCVDCFVGELGGPWPHQERPPGPLHSGGEPTLAWHHHDGGETACAACAPGPSRGDSWGRPRQRRPTWRLCSSRANQSFLIIYSRVFYFVRYLYIR